MASIVEDFKELEKNALELKQANEEYRKASIEKQHSLTKKYILDHLVAVGCLGTDGTIYEDIVSMDKDGNLKEI